jgi:hypothetical protein
MELITLIIFGKNCKIVKLLTVGLPPASCYFPFSLSRGLTAMRNMEEHRLKVSARKVPRGHLDQREINK